MASATYGAGLWGYIPCKPLQVEENNFLKRLLCLPVSASTSVVHREAGLLYLEDLISVRPLLLWISIWSKEETSFTKSIILDCLALDNVARIPWLAYIYSSFSTLFNLTVWSAPLQVLSLSKKSIKHVFLQHRTEYGVGIEKLKSAVALYMSLDLEEGFQNYLIVATSPVLSYPDLE